MNEFNVFLETLLRSLGAKADFPASLSEAESAGCFSMS